MSTTRPDPAAALVADIGASNARAGLVLQPGAEPEAIFTRPTNDFRDLADYLQAAIDHLAGAIPPQRIVCALASPLDGDTVALTNAGWRFSLTATRAEVGVPGLELVNDWVAQGWAVTGLAPHQLRQRAGGVGDAQAPRLALGPGSGLGSALITPCGAGWRVFATEGGHISLGIEDRREAEIALRMQARFGHCSAERLASGIGMEALHDVLRALDGQPPQARSAAHIAELAAAGEPICREVLARFTAALGSAAGDLVLGAGARGGVYLGGGIIPALGEAFDWAGFHARFTAKGRFADYLASVPVYSVEHPNAGLLGLSRYLEATS